MKRFLILFLSIILVSCKVSVVPNDNNTDKKMGIELSLDFSDSRVVYYQKEDVSYLTIRIIRNEEEYKSIKTDLKSKLTIDLSDSGSYSLEVVAYNTQDVEIARGQSSTVYLSFDSGYYYLKVFLMPVQKTFDFDTQITWLTPDDDGENYYINIFVDGSVVKKINVYNGLVYKASLLPIEVDGQYINELYTDAELTQKLETVQSSYGWGEKLFYDFTSVNAVYSQFVSREDVLEQFFDNWKLRGTPFADKENLSVVSDTGDLTWDYNCVYSKEFVATEGFECLHLFSHEESPFYYGTTEDNVEVPERGWTDWFELNRINRSGSYGKDVISGFKKGAKYKYLIEYKPEEKRVFCMIALQDDLVSETFDISGYGVIFVNNARDPQDNYNPQSLMYDSEKDIYLFDCVSRTSSAYMILMDGNRFYNGLHSFMYSTFTVDQTEDFVEMGKTTETYIQQDMPNLIYNLTPGTEYTIIFRIKDKQKSTVEYFIVEKANLDTFIDSYNP